MGQRDGLYLKHTSKMGPIESNNKGIFLVGVIPGDYPYTIFLSYGVYILPYITIYIASSNK